MTGRPISTNGKILTLRQHIALEALCSEWAEKADAKASELLILLPEVSRAFNEGMILPVRDACLVLPSGTDSLADYWTEFCAATYTERLGERSRLNDAWGKGQETIEQGHMGLIASIGIEWFEALYRESMKQEHDMEDTETIAVVGWLHWFQQYAVAVRLPAQNRITLLTAIDYSLLVKDCEPEPTLSRFLETVNKVASPESKRVKQDRFIREAIANIDLEEDPRIQRRLVEKMLAEDAPWGDSDYTSAQRQLSRFLGEKKPDPNDVRGWSERQNWFRLLLALGIELDTPR